MAELNRDKVVSAKDTDIVMGNGKRIYFGDDKKASIVSDGVDLHIDLSGAKKMKVRLDSADKAIIDPALGDIQLHGDIKSLGN